MLTLSNIAGSISDCQPLSITRKNGESDVLIATGSTIQFISSKTGELVSTLNNKYSSKITCMGIHEAKTNKISLTSSVKSIISCSDDGHVEIWKYPFDDNTTALQSQDHIQSIDINACVYDMIPISIEESYLVLGQLTTSSPTDVKKDFKLVHYNFSENEVIRKICELTSPHHNIAKMTLPFLQQNQSTISSTSTAGIVGKGEQDVIFAGSKSKLVIWSALTQTILCRLPCPAVSGSIVCLTASKSNDLLVTGHSRGEILLWHDPALLVLNSHKINTNNNKMTNNSNTAANTSSSFTPVCTRLHWHAHAVMSLALSPNGANLYSGGHEGVLVVWQTRNGNQTFLPRLGNAVSSIVYGEEGLVVTTKDNTIRIVNPASMRMKWQLKQLYTPYLTNNTSSSNSSNSVTSTVSTDKMLRQADSKFICKLMIEPRSGLLATNGYPGELQMTDISGSSGGCGSMSVGGINSSNNILGGIFGTNGNNSGSGSMSVGGINSSNNILGGIFGTNGNNSGGVINSVGKNQSQGQANSYQAIYKHSYTVTDYTRISSKELNTRLYVPSVSLFKFHKCISSTTMNDSSSHYRGRSNSDVSSRSRSGSETSVTSMTGDSGIHNAHGVISGSISHTTENILCTLDVRRGEGVEAEYSLKFWLWQSHATSVTGSHSYRLTAQVDQPHGDCRVSSLDIGTESTSTINNSGSGNNKRVNRVICVTGATDGSVKVWRGDFVYNKDLTTASTTTATVTTAAAVSMNWNCAYSFTYRESVCHNVHLSADASILCVAHGTLLSLWCPATLTLRTTIQSQVPLHSILTINTIQHNTPHPLNKELKCMYLVLTTRKSVSVYDLLTLRHLWTYQTNRVLCSCVATDATEAVPSLSHNISAWIAVCVESLSSVDTTTNASVSVSENLTDKSKKGKDSTVNIIESKQPLQQQLQYQVLLFAPESATPLYTQPLSPRTEISSMTFFIPRLHNNTTGLVLLSTSGELKSLTSPFDENNIISGSSSVIIGSKANNSKNRSKLLLDTSSSLLLESTSTAVAETAVETSKETKSASSYAQIKDRQIAPLHIKKATNVTTTSAIAVTSMNIANKNTGSNSQLPMFQLTSKLLSATTTQNNTTSAATQSTRSSQPQSLTALYDKLLPLKRSAAAPSRNEYLHILDTYDNENNSNSYDTNINHSVSGGDYTINNRISNNIININNNSDMDGEFESDLERVQSFFISSMSSGSINNSGHSTNNGNNTGSSDSSSNDDGNVIRLNKKSKKEVVQPEELGTTTIKNSSSSNSTSTPLKKASKKKTATPTK